MPKHFDRKQHAVIVSGFKEEQENYHTINRLCVVERKGCLGNKMKVEVEEKKN